jgi:N-acetyl-anhydromuramyl-L-alanine amidase AmpD
MRLLLSLILCVPCLVARAQERTMKDLPAFFDMAGNEFGVPPAVLKGISFAETRWEHLMYPDGDTASCTGFPHEYGIMGLRNDEFFGHSLQVGAALIGESPDVVRRDLFQNLRAAAAYLKSLYLETPQPVGVPAGSLESWQPAIARYCGIPQTDLAAQHAYEILARLQKGFNDFGIRIEPQRIDMDVVRALAREAYARATATGARLNKPTGQPDYPGAHWVPAYDGHWYTSGYKRDFVVIHDMEGYYLGVISYFQQASTNASVHYDVNGMQDSPSDAPAGDITQQVEEQYWAWHAICLNRYSFGIEHEGFVANPAWWTPEMYRASAKLVKHLCDTYGIPKDRNHIIGHDEYLNSTWVNWAVSNGYPSTFGTCNSHTDPGVNWDWDLLLQLIKENRTPPRVTSLPPVSRMQVFDKIAVTFNQRMDRVSTESSFHTAPPTAGSFTWTNGFRTMEFKPSSPLAFDTGYSVTLDTSAHNYLGVGIDVNGDGVSSGEVYSFAVRTVGNDTVQPTITATYPRQGQTGISTTVQFEVEVSEPVEPGSLSGSFILLNSHGAAIPLSTPTIEPVGAGERVAFRPAGTLSAGSTYTLNILGTMKDYGGNTIANAQAVAFTTAPERFFIGTVLNALDDLGSWWQPGTSGSTMGYSSTSFSISADTKRSGTGSGKVSYVFSGSGGGVIREYNSLKPTVDPGPLVSAWVFGDNSRNLLEYWFYPLTFVSADTLNWTGWKLVPVSIGGVPTTAARQFAGFVIRQTSGGRTSGNVYFDDLAVASGITGAEDEHAATPRAISLLQNYPNPFNPTTVIPFEIPVAAMVKLEVYDMLGRRVAELAKGECSPGSYRVTWNAELVAAGVYFYRLDVLDGTERSTFIQKMLLLK